jgi:hypothetical protein
MEPNAEGMGGDHTALNGSPSGAKFLDESGGAPNPPPLQQQLCGQDHDGLQDQEPHSHKSPTKSMHHIEIEMDIQPVAPLY